MPIGIYIRTEEGRKDMSIARLGKSPWNKGLKNAQSFEAISGERSVFWKGGRTIHKGYIYVKNLNHPFATGNGYVKEHRLIMEKFIGRYLTKEEVVHHVDRNKLNNNISNLVLFPNHIAHMASAHKRRVVII